MTRFWTGFLCSCGALTLSGCATAPKASPEPIVAPLEVDKPVATGCVPANMASPPDYPDSDAALKFAPDAAARYQLLYAGRKDRIGRLNELEPVIAGCPKAAPK